MKKNPNHPKHIIKHGPKAVGFALLSSVLMLASHYAKADEKNSGRVHSDLSTSFPVTSKNLRINLTQEESNDQLKSVVVNVDHCEVTLKKNGKKVVTNISQNLGAVDLMRLNDGAHVVLGDLNIQKDTTIEEIKFVLKKSGHFAINHRGQRCELRGPSADHKSLSLKLSQPVKLERGHVFALGLDFDAAHSIEVKGHGECGLTPLIRFKSVLRAKEDAENEEEIEDISQHHCAMGISGHHHGHEGEREDDDHDRDHKEHGSCSKSGREHKAIGRNDHDDDDRDGNHRHSGHHEDHGRHLHLGWYKHKMNKCVDASGGNNGGGSGTPVVVPTPTPVVVTPTPTPVVIATPTPSPVVSTPTPAPVVVATPTPAPVVVATPTPAPVVVVPNPTPVVVVDPVVVATPTPAPVVVTPIPTPVIVVDPIVVATPTPAPVVVVPTPTPVVVVDPVVIATPTPAPVVVVPTPTPVVVVDPVVVATPTPAPIVVDPVVVPTPTPVPVDSFGTPEAPPVNNF